MRVSLTSRFPALASRDFALFWGGHLLSLIGTSMQNTVQPLLAYRLSGRPLDLGLIGFALTLPIFFLALPGGVLVEHLEKRRVVLAAQLVMMLDAFALAALTLLGLVEIWHIMVLALVLGIATTFEITARQSMLIELVGRESLPNAIALQSTAFNLSRVLGPAIAAPALAWFPAPAEGWIFFLNGVSFIALVASLLLVRGRFEVPQGARSAPLLAEIGEGARYLAHAPATGLLVVIAGVLGLLAFPFFQQLPVVSKDVLAQLGDTVATVNARNSLLYGAQGAGALLAAFSLAASNVVARLNSRMVVGQAAFLLGLIAIPFSRSPLVSAGLVAAMGWGSVTSLATMNTELQMQVPNELRGRVFSIYLWAMQGSAPFGSVLIGWLTQQWTLAVAGAACGAACILLLSGIQFMRLRMRPANP
jgi:MFS family permease